MAKVYFSAGLREFTGGVSQVQVQASNVRRLVAALDDMFPGIGERLSEGSSVAIDGEILTDADFESVPEDAEVHFLDILQGG
ncbi:MAG: molybdopterin synthase sulfur carrier subunit [Actinobacteria bacterium]|mgnify:FL=1|nr:molybdopterin synthase sulfur carrier subunit [Actinomycetota bacterium]MCS5689562.1 MoaD/ThiS family protein [Acidimicrobiales bacterium]MED5551206.1 MoaD/ThiS family protein [Actinomycetota bacterium]MEE3187218.1 MoaD/ThiS family protein [Actinomycetota bacterium]|tara:strand:- start:246 stop:491 length:246 start_codon:yes stop_codon:yes gene_type:complete